MSKVCDIIGVSKSVLVGNNVSHSNRKTKKRFLPNLQEATLYSEMLNQKFKMSVAVRTLKSIDVNGGLDKFLLSRSNSNLSTMALKIKRAIRKRNITKTVDT